MTVDSNIGVFFLRGIGHDVNLNLLSYRTCFANSKKFFVRKKGKRLLWKKYSNANYEKTVLEISVCSTLP